MKFSTIQKRSKIFLPIAGVLFLVNIIIVFPAHLSKQNPYFYHFLGLIIVDFIFIALFVILARHYISYAVTKELGSASGIVNGEVKNGVLICREFTIEVHPRVFFQVVYRPRKRLMEYIVSDEEDGWSFTSVTGDRLSLREQEVRRLSEKLKEMRDRGFKVIS